jgi:hypothetical protein
VWLAPKWDYLMVKLEQIEKKRTIYYDAEKRRDQWPHRHPKYRQH